MIDSMDLLRRMCAEHGQSAVAKAVNVSPSTICQILSGAYGKGKSSPDNVLQRVIEIYGGLSADCPILGEITLNRCHEERTATDRGNHQRVLLYRTCPTCRNNPKGNKQ